MLCPRRTRGMLYHDQVDQRADHFQMCFKLKVCSNSLWFSFFLQFVSFLNLLYWCNHYSLLKWTAFSFLNLILTTKFPSCCVICPIIFLSWTFLYLLLPGLLFWKKPVFLQVFIWALFLGCFQPGYASFIWLVVFSRFVFFF